MKKHFPAVALATLALAILPATSAQATPWGGGDIEFDQGIWQVDSSAFELRDVSLLVNEVYTDLWDGVGATTIRSASLGLSEFEVYCATDADVDESIEPVTGDLVLACNVSDALLTEAGLLVEAEIRVYSGSDLVRFSLELTNDTLSAMTVDNVETYTEFGTGGEVFNYQNQDANVLAIPATESEDNSAAFNSVGAQWITHIHSEDAPGGLIIGGGDAVAPATWDETDGDEYWSRIGSFTIPAGASRYTATFANWDPESLIAGGYTQDGSVDPALLTASAAATTASMSEFSELTGRLSVGFPVGAVVVNWGPKFPTVIAEPELAATGVDSAVVVGSAGGAIAVLLVGALALVLNRRPALSSAGPAGARR